MSTTPADGRIHAQVRSAGLSRQNTPSVEASCRKTVMRFEDSQRVRHLLLDFACRLGFGMP